MATSKVYNANTGRIQTIKSGPGDSVQNLSFDFNTLGNLIERIDAVAQVTDTMDYDDLNRLTEVVTSNPSLPLNVTKTVAYDAIGNITNKSDVGTYTYDPARVHAVASIAPGVGGTLTATYTYDGNGNLLSGNGRTVTWTSFDIVDDITQGANGLRFEDRGAGLTITPPGSASSSKNSRWFQVPATNSLSIENKSLQPEVFLLFGNDR